MGLRVADIGRGPLDIAARFGLDGERVTLENLGSSALRFVVAAAAGEAAPDDRGAGHLLLPGAREPVQSGAAGVPLWAWSGHPTLIGSSPALGGAPAAAGGGGGLELLVARNAAATTLAAAAGAGDTVLSVAATDGLLAGDPLAVGLEFGHEIVAVDEAASTVEIEAGGLTAAAALGAAVDNSPLFGDGATLDLADPGAGRRYAEIDVRLLYDLPQLNGNPAFYNGRSTGAFYAPRGSWYETLANFGYWFAGGNDEAGLDSYTVGVIHGTSSAAGNTWSVEFHPAAHRLSLLLVAGVPSFAPRAYNLIVAGRAA